MFRRFTSTCKNLSLETVSAPGGFTQQTALLPGVWGALRSTPASGGFPAGTNLAEVAPDHGRGYSQC